MTGSSVLGATHQRLNLPNQDAYRASPEAGRGPRLLVAVADGHGSAKSFRSDSGARFAVDAAHAVLGCVIANDGAPVKLSALRSVADDKLPKDIARAWRARVKEDLVGEPFTGAEWDRLTAASGVGARAEVEANPYVAYGATLLVGLVAEDYHLYLQIGDGDILCVSADGTVLRPIPADDRLLANATTSLCRDEAWRDFRIAHATAHELPALVVMATDGYANSFAEDTGFLQVASDIHTMVSEGQWDRVRAELPEWLADASLHGSGDDVTAAILACIRNT